MGQGERHGATERLAAHEDLGFVLENAEGAPGKSLYATFGEIFQTGRMAETESVFILFVGGALLVWHWGVVRHWPALLMPARASSMWSIAFPLS